MANRNQKTPGNVPGAFYVDDSCIDCDMCRTVAPEFFSRFDEGGYSIVHHQPVTADEVAAIKGDAAPYAAVGRALIEAVYAAADAAGAPSVYWLTQETNYQGRMLYDRIGTKSPFIRYNRAA